MDKFFIRFIMQRSLGAFDDNNFNYEYFMDGSQEEIDEFIKECDEWQKTQADILAKKFDLHKLHNKKILYVGDSITADRLGYRGITTFAAKFNAYNAAISGAHSTDMLRYLYDHIKISKPDIISVMIGTNDALIIANGKNVVSPEEYRHNLSEIIRISKETGAVVIVSTLPPANEKLFAENFDTNSSKLTNDSIDRLSAIIRDEAKNKNVILNDVAKILKHYDVNKIIEKDSIHLTKLGQSIFAENWIDSIIKVFN